MAIHMSESELQIAKELTLKMMEVMHYKKSAGVNDERIKEVNSINANEVANVFKIMCDAVFEGKQK